MSNSKKNLICLGSLILWPFVLIIFMGVLDSFSSDNDLLDSMAATLSIDNSIFLLSLMSWIGGTAIIFNMALPVYGKVLYCIVYFFALGPTTIMFVGLIIQCFTPLFGECSPP